MLAPLILAGVGMAACCDGAFGQNAAGFDDRAVQLFAVNVVSAPDKAPPGLYGVYLGHGMVLTAAHVAGHSGSAHPVVRVDGRSLAAQFVKEGKYDQIDLTLLSIDMRLLPPKLGLRLMPICGEPPRIGQSVVVATPQAIARSSIMSPSLLPADVRGRFNTVIPDVATTGNSGSGVFDALKQCLMGIMSRKVQITTSATVNGVQQTTTRDIAKYFVPAAQIREFLAEVKR